jgi:transposase
MARQRFQITEQETNDLWQAYRQSKDAATRTRCQAVLLYVQNYPVDEIGQITGCQRSSLMEWCQKYRQQGVTGLTDHRSGPRRAKLSAEQVVELGEKAFVSAEGVPAPTKLMTTLNGALSNHNHGSVASR